MSPVEVALALKLAYTQGSWDAVGVVINEIESLFGEIPLSEVLPEDTSGASTAAECECALCAGVGVLPGVPGGTIWLPWNGDIADG